MAKPPPSGPSSDIEGADQTAHEHRKPDPAKGTAREIEKARKEAKGRPKGDSQRY
ncbi:hypothetical protein [Sphingomonas sp. PR090111-T3T-6A]|uniref:hypothetical protein n=1 Tax=Sphingomonas sp. PR090111-T3T-6A TaxID=685778 RepID=UPI00035C15D3|nr:hypothetical protein [Sphingomonas sp. PR090111-T3T-6A]